LFQNLPDQITDFSKLLRTNIVYINYASKDAYGKIEEFSIRNRRNREIFFGIKRLYDNKSRTKKPNSNFTFHIYSLKEIKLLKLVVATRPSFLKRKPCKVKISLGNKNQVGEIVLNYKAKCSLENATNIVYDNNKNAVLFIRKITATKRWIIYSSNRIEIGKIQFYDRKKYSYEENDWLLTFPMDLDLRCKLLLIGAVFFFESDHYLNMQKDKFLQNFQQSLSCSQNNDSNCDSSSEEETNDNQEVKDLETGFDTNWTG